MPGKQAGIIDTIDGGKALLYSVGRHYSLEDGKRLCSWQYHGIMKSRDYKWIQDTFKKKKCVKYVPTESDKNVCYCGRTRNYHGPPESITDNMIRQNSVCKWSLHDNISEMKTNAFGELEFQGAGKRTRGKYIRLSDDTKPDDVLKLLRKVWNLDYPQLLISVTGGAKSFKLSPKLKSSFTSGLLKVVQTTCTWVVTGGTNTGVMKHVGEALQGATNTNLYCIGVATWGIVNNRKKLTERRDGGPINYSVRTCYDTVGASLDNNHSHFLLVDDGRINKYGGEIEFRGKLERSICKMTIEKNRDDRNVPGVQLVIEGGPNTISTVLAALSQNPPMPVVVVKGSGRAADLLAIAHSLTRGPMYEMADVVEHNILFNSIEKVFAGMSDQQHETIYYELLKCVEKRDLITIYQIEDADCNIDEAILKAFMKGKYVRPHDQLDLAMLWNRIDLAKEIFNDDVKWKIDELHASMFNALRRNRPKFVELLLENGVVMGRFLTSERLEALFNCRYEDGDVMLKHIFDKAKRKSSGGRIKLEHINYVLKRLGKGIRIRSDYGRCETILNKAVMSRERVAFIHPLNELFIWAILCNMNEMASMLWTHGDEPLAKALVGRKLCQAMAAKAASLHKQDDIIVAFENEAKKFGDLATHMLNEAYKMNESLAGQLVTYSLENWGRQTCLSLAVASEHLEFVGHPCCQALLSLKWSGEIQFNGSQIYQVLLGLIFPPLILKFKYKPLKEYRFVIMTETEHQQIEDEVREEKKLLKKTKSNNQTEELQDIQQQQQQLQQKQQQRDEGFSAEVTLPRSDSSELISLTKDGNYTISSSDVIEAKKTWYQKYTSFYKAPVTNFVANVIVYTCFLGLYMFVITTKLLATPRVTEWLLFCMVFSYTTEELRQLFQSDQRTMKNKFMEWASSYWNICDALAILLFFVGFGFRMNANMVIAGHVIYAVDIIIWILRFLDIFAVNKHIGPYIVMIGKMTIDMINFFLVLIVFMAAYGVSRYAILNPSRERSWDTLGEIFFVPYFQIFGELFLEYPKSDNVTTIFRTEVNSYRHIELLVAMIMAFYLLIANVLLVNLLIAIFNNTYTNVQSNSNMIWKFQRYHQITEYSTRPILVPPFSLINNTYYLFHAFYSTVCCKRASGERTDRKLKAFLTPDQLHDVMVFEERCLSSFLRRKDAIMNSSYDERLRLVSERVDAIYSMLETYTSDGATAKKCQESKVKVSNERMENLESLTRNLNDKVMEIANSLNRGVKQERPALGKFQSKYGRSISEYPILEVSKQQRGSILVPKSPISLPPGFLAQQDVRRSSAVSATSALYPHFNRERNGVVKRAAYNFRKASLSKKEKLDTFRRSLSLAEETPIVEEESTMLKRRKTLSTERTKRLTESSPPSSFIDSRATVTSNDSNHAVITQGNDIDTLVGNNVADFSCQVENYDAYDVVDGSDCFENRHRSVEGDDVDDDKSNIDVAVNSVEFDVFDSESNLIEDGNIEINEEQFNEDNTSFLHILSRCITYPYSHAQRFCVPDEFVDWKVEMLDYDPPSYISSTVSSYLPWTDPEELSEKFRLIKFNGFDGAINRTSFHGQYELIDHLPRNPMGRTGIAGRGLLCRYGPNHTQNVLFTKWKRKKVDMRNNRLDELEVLVMSKNGKLSLPGGPYEENRGLPMELKHLFSSATLDAIGLSSEKQTTYLEAMNRIVEERELLFEGYMDDERNTDNSWIETSVYNYHDNDGSIINRFIHKGAFDTHDSSKEFLWLDVSFETAYNLSDRRYYDFIFHWLKCTADRRNAHFA